MIVQMKLPPQTRVESFSPETMKSAAKVGPRAVLLDIRLRQLNAADKGLLMSDEMRERTLLTHSVHRDLESSSAVVSCSMRYEMAHSTPESMAEPPLIVEAVFVLTYKIAGLDEVLKEDLEAFAEVNGLFNAWPYWRELLSSTVTRMGVLSPPAPTLRIRQEPSKEGSAREVAAPTTSQSPTSTSP